MTSLVISPPEFSWGNKDTPDYPGLNYMLANPDAWQDIVAYTPSYSISGHAIDNASDDDLKAWLAMLSARNVLLELEVGVIKDWCAGDIAKAIASTSEVIDRVEQFGYTVSAIAMDEPLSDCDKVSPAIKLEDAIPQVAQYVLALKAKYPALKIGLITAYPHMLAADAIKALDALDHACNYELDFYRVDPNWTVFTPPGGTPTPDKRGSWTDLQAVRQYCAGIDLTFELIYWAASYEQAAKDNGGAPPDDCWVTQVIQQAQAVAAVSGLLPDRVVVESWTGLPQAIGPVTDENSFLASVVAVMNTV